MTTEFRGKLLLQIDNYSGKHNNKQNGKRDSNYECECFSKLKAMKNVNTSERRCDPNSESNKVEHFTFDFHAQVHA